MSDNITILVKLFETLKDSSDRNEETTQKLIVQQLELVSHIKNLPISDLKQALKEHAKDSADNIDSCTDTVETSTGGIMEEIKKLASKVNMMIVVVLVTFAILTSTYVYIEHASSQGDQVIEMTKENRNEIVDKIIEEIKNK
jgi:nucleoside-triphosphatase THEP1